MVASFWYLALTSVLTGGQYYLERHFGRSAVRELPDTPLQRLRRLMVRVHASRHDSPSPQVRGR
jgi:polar amino acid transport system permease protein